ncbi:MAG: hypothetical protein KJO87_05835 [Acidimicrobiia bacterium]|nr:hypothetical protein [Acidimicrobiia bacterium]
MEAEEIRLNREVYETLISLTEPPAPAVRIWTGERWGPEDAPATLVLNHPGALRVMLMPPGDLVAGEAYVFGDVDIEGDCTPPWSSVPASTPPAVIQSRCCG